MIKKIPNILCISRMVLVPFILVFLLDNPISSGFDTKTRFLIAGIIFAVAMLTDFFDGKIARKFDAITNFGKFIDPIADKMLVLSMLMAFVDMQIISSVPVILILAREFIVTGLRLGAAGKGSVVAANYWGKIKTTLQGLSIGLIFIFGAFLDIGFDIPRIFTWITAIYTIISAVPYYISMRQYIKD